MIERWTKSDAELLIGGKAYWGRSRDWRAVEACALNDEWALVFENSGGEQMTLTAADVNARRAILWGPPARLSNNGRPRPTKELRAETRRMLRIIQLTTAPRFSRNA